MLSARWRVMGTCARHARCLFACSCLRASRSWPLLPLACSGPTCPSCPLHTATHNNNNPSANCRAAHWPSRPWGTLARLVPLVCVQVPLLLHRRILALVRELALVALQADAIFEEHAHVVLRVLTLGHLTTHTQTGTQNHAATSTHTDRHTNRACSRATAPVRQPADMESCDDTSRPARTRHAVHTCEHHADLMPRCAPWAA